MNFNPGFSRALKKMRKEKSLTVEELAVKIGLSGRQISNWESSTHKPSSENLLRLVDGLGVTLRDFMDKVNEESQDSESQNSD